MRREELLRKFIKDNFNPVHFSIAYNGDTSAILTDSTGTVLEVFCFIDEVLFTTINGERHLTYRLDRDICGNEYFRIIPNSCFSGKEF